MSIDAIKEITTNSDKLITYTLAIFGGTIATLLGTSYLRPKGKIRFIYFLFIIGWSLLGCSFKFGNDLANRTTMFYTENTNSQLQNEIIYKINDNYTSQVIFFEWGIAVFCLWLCLYLTWWIFSDSKI